jgi:two-component system, NarL family, sensor histidine kinase DegS
VPLPAPQTQEFTEQLTLMQSQTRQELEQSQQQLQEIRLLLHQTTGEVEKLMQRELALANRVRDMEINLDSYSRNDIRTLYNANHEVQLRLFMMRSQAEQLEARQQNIREYQDKLRTILELLMVHADIMNRDDAREAMARDVESDGSLVPTWQSAIAVLDGQEEERLRLSRELQDGPAQSISNLMLQLEVCRQVLKYDPDGAQREFDALQAMLATTLRATRRLLAHIRPLALDDLGVVEMLRRDLAELAHERGVAVSVQAALGGTLPKYLQAPLFRLVRGAAVAVLALEQPGSLAVTLQSDAEQVAAQFDAESPAAEEAQGRLDAYLGNPDVIRRVELLGGWAETELVDGQTARLTVRAPIRGQV